MLNHEFLNCFFLEKKKKRKKKLLLKEEEKFEKFEKKKKYWSNNIWGGILVERKETSIRSSISIEEKYNMTGICIEL